MFIFLSLNTILGEVDSYMVSENGFHEIIITLNDTSKFIINASIWVIAFLMAILTLILVKKIAK